MTKSEIREAVFSTSEKAKTDAQQLLEKGNIEENECCYIHYFLIEEHAVVCNMYGDELLMLDAAYKIVELTANELKASPKDLLIGLLAKATREAKGDDDDET